MQVGKLAIGNEVWFNGFTYKVKTITNYPNNNPSGPTVALRLKPTLSPFDDKAKQEVSVYLFKGDDLPLVDD